jgi:D-alanine-D-alanine ligase-like ATP-grasp enzyme
MSLDQITPTKTREIRAKLEVSGVKERPGHSVTHEVRPKSKKVKLAIDREAIKKLKLVAVAYSNIEREWFPTEEAFHAEQEVEKRALEVIAELEKLGVPAKGYPGDAYFMTNLLVDRPDLVLNLVDTLRGKDALQTSVPAALELANTPYTGAGLEGLVIANDRNLVKQMMIANHIPTPAFQFIQRRGTSVEERIGLPLIVKLNESGGSVGIDDHPVKETHEQAQEQVDDLISTYKMPVMVEKFVDGLEITFDVRVDAESGEPYFIDANPNTAFGPSLGLPFTEVLALNNVTFSDALASLISKYARKIQS